MNTKYNIPKIYEDVKSRSKILSIKDKNYFYKKHQLLINTTKSISERISETKKHFKLSIEINTKTEKTIETIKKNKNIEDIFSTSLFNKNIFNSLHFITEEELIPIKTNSVDMFYTLFGLDNINDLPGTLKQIHNSLKKEAMFIGAFIGEGSLNPLYRAFAYADEAVLGGIHPRIHPFFEIKTLANLFYRIGFKDIVADQEKITKKYSSLEELFIDIRCFVRTNLLRGRRKQFTPATIFKLMENKLKETSNDKSYFEIPLNIIFINCWKT